MNSNNVKMICLGVAMLTSTTFYKVFNDGDRGDIVTFFQGWGLAIIISTLVGVLIYRFVNVKKINIEL